MLPPVSAAVFADILFATLAKLLAPAVAKHKLGSVDGTRRRKTDHPQNLVQLCDRKGAVSPNFSSGEARLARCVERCRRYDPMRITGAAAGTIVSRLELSRGGVVV